MARPSRRQFAIVSTEPVIKETVFKAGLYARLSIEDVRDRKDSDSIENQICILENYVSERSYLKIHSVYSDNGEKGTHFDRPEFKRLMKDIKEGIVNCIVVKDLSRFGRDYIETGNYLEKIFPFLGVRFISVNDNYDSHNSSGNNDGFMIALKNLLNDIYAKDISNKIISSFKERQEAGNFLGAHVPYGYTRPADGTYKFIIDEEAAAVIRQIYQWKVNGDSDNVISRRLNDMGIPSPSRHKYIRGEWKNARYEKNIWQRQAIKEITKNEAYLGHKIYGKVQTSLYENKKKSRVPKSEWTIIENDHEPIIDKESFDFVHNKRQEIHRITCASRDKNKHIINSDNIFKDILICADCKCRLTRKRDINKNKVLYGFICSTYYDNSGYKCSSKYISETNTMNAVFESIQKEIELIDSLKNILDKLNTGKVYNSMGKDISNRINKIKQEIEKTSSLQSSLYDDFLENILTEREYLYAKNKYDKDKTVNMQKLDDLLLEQMNYRETMTKNNKHLSLFDGFRDKTALTGEMVAALIQSIELNADKSINVHFKFKDEFILLCNYIESKGIEVKPNGQQ